MPRYKKKHAADPSLNYTQRGFHLKDGRLHLAGGHRAHRLLRRAPPSRGDVQGCHRNFDSIQAAANEAGTSRIWAGQHTRFDHRAGQQLGTRVADFVARRP
jgi:hypothetical protein